MRDGSGPGMRILDFGSFKGQRLGDLPGSYLSWISRHMEGSIWAEFAQKIMDSRDRLGIHGGDRLQRIFAPSPWTSAEDHSQRVRREKKYSIILRSCCKAGALSTGKWMHERIVRKELTDSVYLSNLLLKMYGRCGRIEEAKSIFDNLGRRRNAFSWILLMAAYAQNNRLQDSRLVFEQIPQKDVVSWSGMISLHILKGFPKEAADLFKRMLCDGMKPDRFSFINALDSCSSLKDLSAGRQLHSLIKESGFEDDHGIRKSLIFMYGCCGKPEDAKKAFSGIYYHEDRSDKLTLTLLMAAFTQNGCFSDAVNVFRWMSGTPFPITYILLLEACARTSAYEYGRSVHLEMPKVFQVHVKVGSALVNFYSKAGDDGGKSLQEARACFDRIQRRDSLAWNSILVTYAQRDGGGGGEVLELFKAMHLEGAVPNCMTFAVVISSCRKLEDAQREFLAMIEDHELEPAFESYSSFLEVLARCGELDLAQQLLESMPYEPAWGNLADLKMQVETGSRSLGLGERFRLEVVEDVCGILRQKLVPGEIDVDKWLDYDAPPESEKQPEIEKKKRTEL